MAKFFVMGGGGFAMEPDNPLLDQYILTLTTKKSPKICFIGTASGDSEQYINNFYTAYKTFDCTPSHLALFRPHTRDIESFIAEQDIIHVGGGNTRNLICLWKEWGLDLILKRAADSGTVMSGISAGMLCWFEEGVTDSFGPGLSPLPCLGWLPGSACPHFDGEAERRPTYTKLISERKIKPGLALDDGVGALFIDQKLVECVSSRPNTKGYRFDYDKDSVRESVLIPKQLK